VAAPIEDVSKLPGRKVSDQAQTELGEITDIYAMESGFPMRVAVQTKAGIGHGPSSAWRLTCSRIGHLVRPRERPV